MEINKHPQPSFRPMDVTSPKSQNSQTLDLSTSTPVATVQPPITTTEQPSVPLTSPVAQPPEVSEMPPATTATVASEAAPAVQPAPVDADAELDTIMQEVNTQHTATNAQKSANNLKPILIAVVALIAAFGLAVVAYFAFSNTKKTTTDKASDQSSQTTVNRSSIPTVVTADELSAFSSDVDKQLSSFSDLQDYSVNDISDASLSL